MVYRMIVDHGWVGRWKAVMLDNSCFYETGWHFLHLTKLTSFSSSFRISEQQPKEATPDSSIKRAKSK